ncbi:hypothetical protein Tco_0487265 [Tanacetum coccineum]
MLTTYIARNRLEEVKINDKLHFVEEPMEIMDREVKKLKKRRIPIVKVRWNSRRGPEFTWEREDEMKRKSQLRFVIAAFLCYFHLDYYSEYQYAVSIKEDTAYPCLHSPKTTEDKAQYAVSRETQYAVSRETQYTVFKIWNEYNILKDIKCGPYSNKSPILCDLDNSTSNVLIPLDSWTSGLLVYKLPLSGLMCLVTNQTVPVSQAENPIFPLELGTRTDIVVYVVRSMALCSIGGVYVVRSMALCSIGGVYVVRSMALCSIGGVLSYAFSDSLLLTPLCCDDIHDVTPRVSALAGCDRLVSEPLVIEK